MLILPSTGVLGYRNAAASRLSCFSCGGDHSAKNFGVAIKQAKRRGMTPIENHQRGEFAGLGWVVHHLPAVAIFDERGEVGPAEIAARFRGQGDAAGESGERFAQMWVPISGESFVLWVSYGRL